MQFEEVNYLLSAYEYYRYENNSKKTIKSLEKDDHKDHSPEDCPSGLVQHIKKGWRDRVDYASTLMNTPHYELLQNFLSLFNLIFIVLRDLMHNESEEFIKVWMIVMVVFNLLFLLE